MNKTMSALIASLVSSCREKDLSGGICLNTANALCACVAERAAEMGVNAVIAVAGPGGHPVSVQCMDDAYIASYDIAVNKAFTATALKMSTAELKPLAQPGGSLYGIQFTNNGKIVIFGGGVPLYSKGGRILGGLGVSGGTEEQDTELGKFGGELLAACLKNI